jgi:dTMP kinase
MQLKRGILLVAEGIDGSGKSTLVKNLAAALAQKNLPLVVTHEPGATALGKTLRALLQERTAPIGSKAEYLLFAANRAQHFDELVIPHLNNNELVLSDRMADSSLVYQGYGRGLEMNMLKSINAWTMNSVAPDLILYVKVDLATAMSRINKRNEALTAFEKEKETFTQKLIAGFDELFANRADAITLDGTQTPEQLTADATEAVMKWLDAKGLIE